MPIELRIDVGIAPEGIEELLNKVASACFKAESVPEMLFSVRLVDEAEIQRLNKLNRGIDLVTDVLSFPAVKYPAGKTAKDCPKRIKREYDPLTGYSYIGDCAICLSRAAEQANEFGHSLERELGYLTAHSAFHLMGYDHMNEIDAKAMRDMEKRTIRDIGLWRTSKVTDKKLFEMAKEAMEMSYSPYSNFKVGACILTDDGKTYKGCNFENASYGATICAERCAASNAIVNGSRKFSAIAIAASSGYGWPCGICRQVLNEFGGGSLRVIVGVDPDNLIIKSLNELLPESFGPDDLGIEG